MYITKKRPPVCTASGEQERDRSDALEAALVLVGVLVAASTAQLRGGGLGWLFARRLRRVHQAYRRAAKEERLLPEPMEIRELLAKAIKTREAKWKRQDENLLAGWGALRRWLKGSGYQVRDPEYIAWQRIPESFCCYLAEELRKHGLHDENLLAAMITAGPGRRFWIDPEEWRDPRRDVQLLWWSSVGRHRPAYLQLLGGVARCARAARHI